MMNVAPSASSSASAREGNMYYVPMQPSSTATVANNSDEAAVAGGASLHGGNGQAAADDLTRFHHENENHYLDANLSWIPTETLKKAAKTVYPVCNRTLQVMESIGGVIVNTFGLNQSRFQYAVDEYHRRERLRVEKEQLAYRKERERILEKARQGLDVADDDEDEDDDDGAGGFRGSYCPPIVAERVPLSTSL